MKIMFAIDRINGFGGAQRVIVNLANSFFKDGNSVSMLLTGDTGDSVYSIDNGIKILHAEQNDSRFKKIKQLRKIIISEKPDVIVSFLTMVNALIILATIGTGIPVIISERNDPDYCTRKEKQLARLTYRYAKAVVVQTEVIKNKIKAFYKHEVYVIPNPVVIGEDSKQSYILTHSISAVGRLNPQKNYYLMLEAMSKFNKKHSDYVLHIYGDGELKEKLIIYAEKMGIEKNVVFHGNDPDVKKQIIDTDFFVMSSDYEGMPNSLAEAMSLGLPVISTDCDGGGAAFLITDMVNGRLVNKGDVDMLFHLMCEYAESPFEAEKMGREAKKIQNRFSITAVNNLWFGVIKDVLHE